MSWVQLPRKHYISTFHRRNVMAAAPADANTLVAAPVGLKN
jgi:hypothetical protein